jgi:hypothetical protein
MPGAMISRGEQDRMVREALAGVFALTPVEFYVYLGGEVEAFDAEARSIMEWWRRSSGYAEQDVAPPAGRRRGAYGSAARSGRRTRGGCTRTTPLSCHRLSFRSDPAAVPPGVLSKSSGQLHDQVGRRIAQAALDSTDVGPINFRLRS